MEVVNWDLYKTSTLTLSYQTCPQSRPINMVRKRLMHLFYAHLEGMRRKSRENYKTDLNISKETLYINKYIYIYIGMRRMSRETYRRDCSLSLSRSIPATFLLSLPLSCLSLLSPSFALSRPLSLSLAFSLFLCLALSLYLHDPLTLSLSPVLTRLRSTLTYAQGVLVWVCVCVWVWVCVCVCLCMCVCAVYSDAFVGYLPRIQCRHTQIVPAPPSTFLYICKYICIYTYKYTYICI